MDVTVSGGAASQGVEAASDVAEGGDPGGRKLEVGEFVVADTAGDDVGDDAISLQERQGTQRKTTSIGLPDFFASAKPAGMSS